MRLQVKRQIAGGEQADDDDDHEIAPLLAGNDLARGRSRQQDEETDSIAAAGPQPIQAEILTAMRPATQVENSSISGLPCSGSLPVQFGTAVSRKPATTAAMYPNSISWTCQSRGANAVLSSADRKMPATTPG